MHDAASSGRLFACKCQRSLGRLVHHKSRQLPESTLFAVKTGSRNGCEDGFERFRELGCHHPPNGLVGLRPAAWQWLGGCRPLLALELTRLISEIMLHSCLYFLYRRDSPSSFTIFSHGFVRQGFCACGERFEHIVPAPSDSAIRAKKPRNPRSATRRVDAAATPFGTVRDMRFKRVRDGEEFAFDT